LNDSKESKVHELLTGWNLFMVSLKEIVIVVLMNTDEEKRDRGC
jgi:hypothetical protein